MIAAGMTPPSLVRASGGGIASPVWRQVLADVLETDIATVNTTEGAAFGAALLATPAAGWFGTVSEAAATIVKAETLATPGPAAGTYRGTHAAYRELYPALVPMFHGYPPSTDELTG